MATVEAQARDFLASEDCVLKSLCDGRLDDWTITPGAILHLWHILCRLDPPPRRILEMGSGVSTLVLAKYAAGQGSKVVSLEHDPEYAEQTGDWLMQEGLCEHVELIVAPLKEKTFHGITAPVYDVPAERLAGEPIEFVLIDGPPGHLSDGRRGCLPMIADFLGDRAILLLDDGYRDAEQRSWQAWRERFPQISDSRLVGTGKGIMEAYWQRGR